MQEEKHVLGLFECRCCSESHWHFPPALRLAAVAAQESQHHQEREGSSGPMEAGLTVAMIKKAIQPLLLWRKKKKKLMRVGFFFACMWHYGAPTAEGDQNWDVSCAK